MGFRRAWEVRRGQSVHHSGARGAAVRAAGEQRAQRGGRRAQQLLRARVRGGAQQGGRRGARAAVRQRCLDLRVG